MTLSVAPQFNLLLAYLVIHRRILCEPIFFNLRNVSDECLVSCLHHFVEDDPICLAVLSNRLVMWWTKGAIHDSGTYKHQRARMGMECHTTINCLKRSVRLHSCSMHKVT